MGFLDILKRAKKLDYIPYDAPYDLPDGFQPAFAIRWEGIKKEIPKGCEIYLKTVLKSQSGDIKKYKKIAYMASCYRDGVDRQLRDDGKEYILIDIKGRRHVCSEEDYKNKYKQEIKETVNELIPVMAELYDKSVGLEQGTDPAPWDPPSDCAEAYYTPPVGIITVDGYELVDHIGDNWVFTYENGERDVYHSGIWNIDVFEKAIKPKMIAISRYKYVRKEDGTV